MMNFFKVLNKFEKLLFIFSILLLFCIISLAYKNNNYIKNYENYENYENINNVLSIKNHFEIKRDNDIYDKFYSDYYDKIHYNNTLLKNEIGEVSKLITNSKNTNVLDIASTSGNYVGKLSKMNSNIKITGIDNSKYMISLSNKKYPKCNFIKDNILKLKHIEKDSYSHVLCLGRTIYYFNNKEKDLFLDNCYDLLNYNGTFIIHLIDRNKFNYYNFAIDDNVIYNSENYGKKNDQLIIKFNNNIEYMSTIAKNKDYEFSKNEPYLKINEKFQNYNNNSIRKNETNLFIDSLNNMIKLIENKGFTYKKNVKLSSYEFLYVFKK